MGARTSLNAHGHVSLPRDLTRGGDQLEPQNCPALGGLVRDSNRVVVDDPSAMPLELGSAMKWLAVPVSGEERGDDHVLTGDKEVLTQCTERIGSRSLLADADLNLGRPADLQGNTRLPETDGEQPQRGRPEDRCLSGGWGVSAQVRAPGHVSARDILLAAPFHHEEGPSVENVQLLMFSRQCI